MICSDAGRSTGRFAHRQVPPMLCGRKGKATRGVAFPSRDRYLPGGFLPWVATKLTQSP
jgi:hypothetical protein